MSVQHQSSVCQYFWSHFSHPFGHVYDVLGKLRLHMCAKAIRMASEEGIRGAMQEPLDARLAATPWAITCSTAAGNVYISTVFKYCFHCSAINFLCEKS